VACIVAPSRHIIGPCRLSSASRLEQTFRAPSR
jgi:hypothetical protein